METVLASLVGSGALPILVALILLLAVIACPRMATSAASRLGLFPASFGGSIVPLFIYYPTQITTSVTTGPTRPVLWACRLIKFEAGIRVAGGSTVMTDLDAVLKIGSNTLATAAVLDSSTGTYGSASPVSEALSLIAAGDVLEVEWTVTGGSSPTADGAWACAWVEVKNPTGI